MLSGNELTLFDQDWTEISADKLIAWTFCLLWVAQLVLPSGLYRVLFHLSLRKGIQSSWEAFIFHSCER